MPLACSCDYGEPDGFQLLDTKRGRRCSSCKKKIQVGELCIKFSERKFLCEECGDWWFSLEDLGFLRERGYRT